MADRRASAAAVVLTLCLALASLSAGWHLAAPPASAADPVRILIVGDSVTQGSAGDWTWRYRLWRHFARTGVSVDFVGPRNDLFDNISETLGCLDYLNPAFDTDHAARWGMSFLTQERPIGELVETYHPDVVVELLGLIDLVRYGADAQILHDRIGTFVRDARAADPGLDLVVGRVAQTWYNDVPAANALISDIPAELGTDESRIQVARTDAGFKQVADTWDPAHPDAAGEIKVAAAVADALAALGVGSRYPRPFPHVPLGPRRAPTVSAAPASHRVRLRWRGSPGSDHEYVWIRDRTRRQAWHRLASPRPGTSWTVGALINGHRYALKLQPVKGYHAAAADVRSNTVSVVPRAQARTSAGHR